MGCEINKEAWHLFPTLTKLLLYFLQFNPEEVAHIKKLKNKLDPKDLINSYRLVKAKMKYWVWYGVKLRKLDNKHLEG